MNLVKTGVVAVAIALGVSVGGVMANPVSSETGPNLVTNPGFETGSLSGWTQSGNGGFTAVNGFSVHSGSFALRTGPVNSLGFISQDLATVAGTSYNIHVWYRNEDGTPNAFTIDFDGVNVFSSINEGTHGYTEIVIDPMATSALTTLRIGFQQNPSFFDIDDISVRATVPEPFSLALLGIGLAGLGFARRKAA